MPAVKLVVLYPVPKDVQTFERLYQDEHVALVEKGIPGKTKFVATKVQGSPQAARRTIGSRRSTSHPWRRFRPPRLRRAARTPSPTPRRSRREARRSC